MTIYFKFGQGSKVGSTRDGRDVNVIRVKTVSEVKFFRFCMKDRN